MKTITFITRLSRSNADIQAIYNSIRDNFDSYYWLVYIERGTIDIPPALQEIIDNDNAVIVNNKLVRDGIEDVHFSRAVDDAFNSVYAKDSKWVYVLDDDNIVHEKLSSVIECDADLILNRLIDKRGLHCIDNPCNLTVNYCVGHVDWASALFSSEFFQKNINHIVTKTPAEDGITVRLYLEHNARVVYTNETAGYYNYLR